jgi:AraC-like DNA-binding protein
LNIQRNSMDARITRAVEDIARRIAEPLSIAALAAGVSLSPSRFAHLFRHEVGTSPARYLHAVRMLRARALLEGTFLTVKEVMAQVGCNDPSHFSRDFRRFHGVAPRECRSLLEGARIGDESYMTNAATSAAITAIAALANERRNWPTKPRPRARAPGIQWNLLRLDNTNLITVCQGALS